MNTEFDDVTNTFGYNGRFFWQVRSGNIIYLVYNNNMDRLYNSQKNFSMIEEQILLKIQMSIRF